MLIGHRDHHGANGAIIRLPVSLYGILRCTTLVAKTLTGVGIKRVEALLIAQQEQLLQLEVSIKS